MLRNYFKREVIAISTVEIRCDICKKPIGDNVPRTKKNQKFFHTNRCFPKYEEINRQRKSFLAYVSEIQGTTKLDPQIFKQIKSMQDEFDFSYTGMELTLRYAHETLRMPVTSPGIGIIPYLYEETKAFHIGLEQITGKAMMSDFEIKVETVYIHEPQIKNVKKHINIEEIT